MSFKIVVFDNQVPPQIKDWPEPAPPEIMSWLRPCAQWCAKLAHLADIFKHLDELNSKMQGKEENLPSSSDKLRGFKSKLTLWRSCVEQGRVEMFPLYSEHSKSKTKIPTLSLSICKPLTRDVLTIFQPRLLLVLTGSVTLGIRALWRAQPTCHCRHRSNWQR